MQRKLLIVLLSIVCIFAAGLAAVCIMQNVKYRTLDKNYRQLAIENKELTSSIDSLKSKDDELSKELNSRKTLVEQQNKKQDITSSSSGKKIAYLTFDDGPSNITPKLLDELRQYNVKATFFVVGEDTAQREAWLKREANEGHTIGIHSWTHKYSYIYSSESNYLDDFSKIKNMIVSVTGVQPKFMRFPGGTNNTVSLKYNNGTPIVPTLLNDVEGFGLTTVDWNAGGMDAANPVPSKSTIVNGIVNKCRYLHCAIILLHDSAPHESSVEAVPEIITKLRAMGFTFEPITSSEQAITFNPATSSDRVTASKSAAKK